VQASRSARVRIRIASGRAGILTRRARTRILLHRRRRRRRRRLGRFAQLLDGVNAPNGYVEEQGGAGEESVWNCMEIWKIRSELEQFRIVVTWEGPLYKKTKKG